MRRFFDRLILAAGLAGAVQGQAQDYPSKPITIIVPFPPGGGVDRVARIVGEKLREKWGQPIVVENRPGAAANIGAAYVAKAAADGYTLLFTSPGPLAVNKALFPNLNYEPDQFVPVSVLMSGPNMLTAHPKLGTDTVQQLIALAKARPSGLNYATQGVGSTAHLGTVLFESMTGVKMTHVPYKGTAPAVTDLLSGQVEVMFLELANAGPYIRAGKIKVLAAGSEKRVPSLPNVPALAELLPGFLSTNWSAVVAPPGTAPAIAQKLAATIAEILKRPDVAKQLSDLGNEPIGSTPEEMALFVKEESRRWGELIRREGLTAE